MRVHLNPLLWALLCGLVCTHPVSAQYYDLTVGTERHFARVCSFMLGQACPTGSTEAHTFIEKVVDEKVINGTTYAVVAWTGWAGKDPIGNPIQVHADTTYYRFIGSLLHELKDGMESIVFDYGFSKGDSVMSVLQPYLSASEVEHVFENNIANPPASIILIDTLLHFSDGISRRILWGNDTLKYIDGTHSSPKIELDFIVSDNLPFPQDTHYYRPFYYIEGIGVLHTPFNHRNIKMCGYRKPDGFHFGCVAPVTTEIEHEVFQSLPTNVAVLQNYPNPFNPSTQIRWTLDTARQTRLSVHDLLGREVAVLANGVMPAGSHQAVFDGAGLASGIYLVRLEAGGTLRTLRITLMK